jgi:protein gp37
MADVFEDHPVAARSRPRLFELIEQTPWLDWLLLSKRPQNMVAMAPAAWAKGWPFNVWAGTSAGCQDSANAFVHHITQVPAPVRFVSAEPLLGRVDLSLRLGVQRCPWGWTEQTGRIAHLEWIIVGGESGAPRREMDLEAAADLVAQARAARVPVFVKQDSHRYPGQRGRLSDAMWALKQLPSPRWSALGPRAA